MQYHINTSKKARDTINAEVKRRNRSELVSHTQESVSSEIIETWEAQRREEVERSVKQSNQ